MGSGSSISSWLIPVITTLFGGVVGYAIRFIYGKFKLVASEAKAETIVKEAKDQATKYLRKSEAEAKEMILEAKESLLKERKENELIAFRNSILNIWIIKSILLIFIPS